SNGLTPSSGKRFRQNLERKRGVNLTLENVYEAGRSCEPVCPLCRIPSVDLRRHRQRADLHRHSARHGDRSDGRCGSRRDRNRQKPGNSSRSFLHHRQKRRIHHPRSARSALFRLHHGSRIQTYTIQDVELQVAQRATVNATLQVGGVEQEVTVGATAPMVETSESSVGQVVNPSTVEHMPLNGRNFWQLTSLTPGATYTPGGQGTRTGGSSIRSSAV